MSDTKARFIVERWHVGIPAKDKRHENLSGLFDLLASQLFKASISFDDAYVAMKSGSKCMYPSSDVIKHQFKKAKNKSQNIQDYSKQWHDSIDKIALDVFYNYYKIEGIDESKPLPDIQGSMKTDDELNEEDFWNTVKSVSRDKPWLFDEESSNDSEV